MSPSEIFSPSSSSNLFKSIDHFLKCIALVGIEGVVNSSEVATAISIHDREEYKRIKWSSIELLLTFIELLLTKHTNETVSFKVRPGLSSYGLNYVIFIVVCTCLFVVS